MRFEATLLQGGKTATGIHVPDEVVAALGPSRRPPVRVTFAGHTYRTSVASMRGRFMLPVSAEIREHTGVAAGDELDIEIELDTEPREVAVPDDLTAALAEAPAARERFERLSYSNKRRYVLAIEGAKAAETRARRIAKTVEELMQTA
jgi:bifunctional DNA-binding transcriptional regulator/antitoxin component of YhaV-PrlF toxin-antitoxin module